MPYIKFDLSIPDEYWERQVVITTEELAHYIDACDLLARGTRLNADERQAWEKASQRINMLMPDPYEPAPTSTA